MGYKGNSNLKDHNEVVPITVDQVNELIKCSEDIIYFAENYVYITNIDDGNILIKLHDYQKRMLKSFVDSEHEVRKNRVVLSARQIGKCVSGSTKITVADKMAYLKQNIFLRAFKNMVYLLLTGKKIEFKS